MPFPIAAASYRHRFLPPPLPVDTGFYQRQFVSLSHSITPTHNRRDRCRHDRRDCNRHKRHDRNYYNSYSTHRRNCLIMLQPLQLTAAAGPSAVTTLSYKSIERIRVFPILYTM
jgi:hypothetical protein